MIYLILKERHYDSIENSYDIVESSNDIDKINDAPPRLPSTIKLYESKSIEGLLLDHREVKPLAVNDWELIQNKLIGIKNN
jgi:hypothetical protein